ncbi:uncharacterized protein BROUX77_000592 [Berkeleyomyces rouxiae]|uniref:uncharacterized protein n=1 Tax=Berkeleyomyces rouxiae TaxID=2035830 RepID=UPI003B75E4B9
MSPEIPLQNRETDTLAKPLKLFISHLPTVSHPVGYISVRHNPSGAWYGFELSNTSPVSLGRNADSSIQLNDTLVSRKHLEIFPVIIDDSQLNTPLFFIRDRASDNGTTELCFAQYQQISANWSAQEKADFETLRPTYIVSRKLLGEGAQAKVYVAFNTKTQCQVACKAISLQNHCRDPSALRKRSRLESTILRKLNHPNVLQYEYAAVTDRSWYLVTSLSTGGDLFSFMTKTDINETVIRTIILQVVMGLVHIHSRRIVHRDIKPENIHFTVVPKVTYPVVIADFGHAVFLKRGKKLTSLAGTAPFRAPEIHYSEPYDYAVDVWALGISILLMLMPNHLDQLGRLYAYSQEGVDSSLDRVFRHSRIKIRRHGRDFIRACLKIDRKSRMTAGDALSHRWIGSMNEDMRDVYKRVMTRWKQSPPRIVTDHGIPPSRVPSVAPKVPVTTGENNGCSKAAEVEGNHANTTTIHVPWSDSLPLLQSRARIDLHEVHQQSR